MNPKVLEGGDGGEGDGGEGEGDGGGGLKRGKDIEVRIGIDGKLIFIDHTPGSIHFSPRTTDTPALK
jgi:hypothetical protein